MRGQDIGFDGLSQTVSHYQCFFCCCHARNLVGEQENRSNKTIRLRCQPSLYAAASYSGWTVELGPRTPKEEFLLDVITGLGLFLGLVEAEGYYHAARINQKALKSGSEIGRLRREIHSSWTTNSLPLPRCEMDTDTEGNQDLFSR